MKSKECGEGKQHEGIIEPKIVNVCGYFPGFETGANEEAALNIQIGFIYFCPLSADTDP